MADSQRLEDDEAGHYRFSEDAQLRLIHVSEQLTLLATLTMPVTHRTTEDLCVQPSALSYCFAQLAGALQSALGEAQWHAANDSA